MRDVANASAIPNGCRTPRPLRIAVDTCVGTRGVKALRAAGHDVVVVAEQGESGQDLRRRAVVAGAELVISQSVEAIGVEVFRPAQGESGLATVERFLRVRAAAAAAETAAPDPLRSCIVKKRYDTETLADSVRRRCERERGAPLRVYGCEICGGWHLTGRDAQRVEPRPGWRPALRPQHERRRARRRS